VEQLFQRRANGQRLIDDQNPQLIDPPSTRCISRIGSIPASHNFSIHTST
jgi:hypothetical protein